MEKQNPTNNQKSIITANGLSPDNWVVVFESKTTLEIVSKRSGQRRVLEKRGRK